MSHHHVRTRTTDDPRPQTYDGPAGDCPICHEDPFGPPPRADGRASPALPAPVVLTATSPGIAEAAARFGVAAGALADLLSDALPRVAAGRDPETALREAMDARTALLTELAAGETPFAQAARRHIADAVWALLQAPHHSPAASA